MNRADRTGGPPLHFHPDRDEWFLVLEGEFLFQLGAEAGLKIKRKD